MNKKTYNCLTILSFLFLILILAFALFKKDYGFDMPQKQDSTTLLSFVKFVPEIKNETINNKDFLKAYFPKGKFGSSLTTSILGDPKTFNPYNASDATSAELCDLMYDGLVSTDPKDGQIKPKLAKSFEIDKSKKVYTFYLRKGLTWSDGKPLTAKDVYFTYNTVIFGGFGDGSTKDAMTINKQLPKVELLDDYTVKFTTPAPFAPFLRTLSSAILPEHIFKNVTKKGNSYFLTFQGIDTNPKTLVTSGPFRLKEYIPSQRIIFEKSQSYYLITQENEMLPYLSKLVFQIVGDMNNQTLKFESGETDILSISGGLLDRYKELEKTGNFDIYNLGPTSNTTFLVFNLNNRKNKQGKYYVNPIKQRWFQDRNFRTAIDYAIDRDDLVLNIFSGLASPLFSAEAPNSLFVNEKVARGHKKNLAYAKSLLALSGFYYKNNQLYDKFNNPVEFELLTNAGNTQREATGVSIKQDLENLGIKVNFKAIEFNSLISRTLNSVDFDCVIIALTSNVLEPHSGNNVWKHDGALHIFNQRTNNDLKESDKILPFEKELDEIFEKGALELDFQKRKEIYNKYQELIAKENPMIYLYSPLNIYAIRKKFKNIYPTALGGLIYDKALIYVDEN